ncbi:HNH endonuclease [Kitasatospora sp. NA04385]|uniref:YDG/SRA domain-containing protein n=1 Tax=Kitasatospora sp. NA04385 TaxID=2742135 RepID=UPI0015929549|nr:YDG/SRA domain-containing protein [Kitasatospora sp. NA04385]QKW20479.1 HNH endonuclease [Kitasatospora sp. NA04385]
MIGEVPGVEIGQEFSSRREAHEAGVHRPLQAGICGTKRSGAESIVVSGGYKDDQDYGDVIVYTGHGGQDAAKNQVSDQSLDDPGNAALVTSHLEGQLVRVLRGAHRGSHFAPRSGYRYDGLYRVASYGSTVGTDGHRIWQFRLEADQEVDVPETPDQDAQSVLVTVPAPPPSGNATPLRVRTEVQRTVRSGAVVRQVKSWHGSACQVCGLVVVLPGGVYSEGAHIQALGSPYDGPDTTDNVLCLCPTCHVMFDGGAIVLTDDLGVVRHGELVGSLRTHPQHVIDPVRVRNHRERWGG